jgi:CHASE2 domain-containing sensor protein
MERLVVLNLGQGNWRTAFSLVTAQIWLEPQGVPIQVTGSLSAAAPVGALYDRWRQLYPAVYQHLSHTRRADIPGFEIDATDVTHVSYAEFEQLSQELQRSLNDWLRQSGFQRIEQQLRTHLFANDDIRFVILAHELAVLRFPWQLWAFFDDYPQAELAINPLDYGRATLHSTITTPPAATPRRSVKILAILGDRRGIDLEQDQQLLNQLPHTQITWLIEPTRRDLDQQLWEAGWDILFFAGHSFTNRQGYLKINAQESLTTDQLRYGLRHAIAHGLKLAIFNSCDGIGLAQDLASLNIPQVIVMRESVPDQVAQQFLKQLLLQLTRGIPLSLAVRQSREQLQAIEGQFPCATWLPVLCQNPAETPFDWATVYTPATLPAPAGAQRSWWRLVGLSVVVSGLVIGLRTLGLFQAAELAAYDRLLRLRPAEPMDQRLLVVTVDAADIQAQGSEMRNGSLSDRTLVQLLTILNQATPRAIGLDIYRDFPAQNPALVSQLRHNERLFTICKRPDSQDDPTGIAPPPEINGTDRLGFSDFVQDADGAVRRQIIVMSPAASSRCPANYAFSANLALNYLVEAGIMPEFSNTDSLKLGPVTLSRLTSHFGGYQGIDAAGFQIPLTYRNALAGKAIAPQVKLSQLLKGEVNPSVIRDRIVLVGITAPSSGDRWRSPYGQSFVAQLPGVMIHAQMVSQLLSVVLDRRPVLRVWPAWGEAGWILLWALLGSALGGLARRRWLCWLGVIGGMIGAWLIAYWGLLHMLWLPLVPVIIAGIVTSQFAQYLASVNRHGPSQPR